MLITGAVGEPEAQLGIPTFKSLVVGNEMQLDASGPGRFGDTQNMPDQGLAETPPPAGGQYRQTLQVEQILIDPLDRNTADCQAIVFQNPVPAPLGQLTLNPESLAI